MDDFMRIILGLTDKKIIPDYKRQSENVQKWEFKNVQFYSFNTPSNVRIHPLFE